MYFLNVKEGLIDKDKIFKCYSKNFKKFLDSKQIYPISPEKYDENNKKYYFKYMKCKQLEEAQLEWTRRKETNNLFIKKGSENK